MVVSQLGVEAEVVLAETVVKLQHMVLVVPQPGVVLLLGVAGQEEALLGVVLKVQVPFGIEVKVEVQLQVATKVATPPGIEIREETPPGIEVREAVLPGKVEVLGKVVTILHGEVRKVIPVHGVVTDTKKCCFSN